MGCLFPQAGLPLEFFLSGTRNEMRWRGLAVPPGPAERFPQHAPTGSPSPWKSMDIDGCPWISMVFHGYPWISMDIRGYPWMSMDVHEHPWISMHDPWICMDNPWISMDYLWISRILFVTNWHATQVERISTRPISSKFRDVQVSTFYVYELLRILSLLWEEP